MAIPHAHHVHLDISPKACLFVDIFQPPTHSFAEYGLSSCTAARTGYYVPAAAATTEIPCSAGTYSSNTASTSCTECTAGSQCPNGALSNPQKCSPGLYSSGGVSACVKCSAGTFNNIQGATGCCPCAAGWFNVSAYPKFRVKCLTVVYRVNRVIRIARGKSLISQSLRDFNIRHRCSNQRPYSSPGAASDGACSATPGAYAISGSSSQGADGSCRTCLIPLSR